MLWQQWYCTEPEGGPEESGQNWCKQDLVKRQAGALCWCFSTDDGETPRQQADLEHVMCQRKGNTNYRSSERVAHAG